MNRNPGGGSAAPRIPHRVTGVARGLLERGSRRYSTQGSLAREPQRRRPSTSAVPVPREQEFFNGAPRGRNHSPWAPSPRSRALRSYRSSGPRMTSATLK